MGKGNKKESGGYIDGKEIAKAVRIESISYIDSEQVKEADQQKDQMDMDGKEVAEAGNKEAEKGIKGLEEPVKTECVIDFSNIPKCVRPWTFRITIKERQPTSKSNFQFHTGEKEYSARAFFQKEVDVVMKNPEGLEMEGITIHFEKHDGEFFKRIRKRKKNPLTEKHNEKPIVICQSYTDTKKVAELSDIGGPDIAETKHIEIHSDTNIEEVAEESKKESEKSMNGKAMAHPGHKGSTSDINSEKVIEFSRKVANVDSDV